MEKGERLVPLREIGAKEKAEKLASRMGHKGEIAGSHNLLELEGVSKSFRIRKSGWITQESASIQALKAVTLNIRHGECLGLVGESGCGKSTLSKVIMRAVTPDSGSITYKAREGDIDILGLSGKALESFRTRVQYVFQDPFSSLNPRMRVGDIIEEPLEIHGIGTPAERRERVEDLLELVGLDRRHRNRYPHSFSGGQRQRLGIARALALDPELLILDEPVSALDVSIQAQVLNLLRDLKDTLGLTYLFISHNLAVVDYIADRIAVMYGGRVVEIAPNEELLKHPRSPGRAAPARPEAPGPSLYAKAVVGSTRAQPATSPGLRSPERRAPVRARKLARDLPRQRANAPAPHRPWQRPSRSSQPQPDRCRGIAGRTEGGGVTC